tara:strand:- start:14668 stop:14838 length:171 start_codon:yes stop_codon:yes gene_type:complete
MIDVVTNFCKVHATYLRSCRSFRTTAASAGQIDVATHTKFGTFDRRFGTIQEAMDA